MELNALLIYVLIASVVQMGYAQVSTFFQKSLERQVTRPQLSSGGPTTISVQLYISNVASVSVLDMQYHMDIFYRQTWVDERLAWNASTNEGLKGSTVPVTLWDLSELWLPDAYFFNSKSVEFHDQPAPNFLFRLHPNGTVLFSQRLTMVVSCFMDLRLFPFDTQYCPVRLESYSYVNTAVNYQWTDVPVEVNPNLRLQSHHLSIRNEFIETNKEYSTGNFSGLLFEMIFTRLYIQPVLNDYFPTFFLVMLSWTNFWIDNRIVAARISLCITVILAHITKAGSVSSTMPKVSYTTASDVWLLVCLTSHFCVLLEFTLAHVATKSNELAKDGDRKVFNFCLDGHSIDKISRILFPSVFVICMIVYGVVYNEAIATQDHINLKWAASQ